MKKIFRILIYVIGLIVLPLGAFLFIPASIPYSVSERYEFQSNQTGATNYLAVMLPRSGPYQMVENMFIQGEGDIITNKEGAVDVLFFTGSRMQGVNQSITISYDVRITNGKPRWEGDTRAADLQPQTDIESDAPVLVEQAVDLCRPQTEDPAYTIYNFTAGHVSWPQGTREGSGQSALEAYTTQIGVCGEFANLMTAFSRACGIPARSVVGLAMPMFQAPVVTSTRTWNHPAASHAWVEINAGEEWMLADPSWASTMPFDRLLFGRVMGRYLSYGELADHDRVYEQMIDWAEEQGEITAAMSAPVKFAASAEGGQIEVTPVISVRKGWDIRWLTAIGLYLVIVIIASIVEKRVEK